MLKILLILLLMTNQAWATVQWRDGTGANTLLGTSNAADIDTNTFNNIVSPLDSLLANYREGLNINYNSAAQFTVSSGSITVSNSDGSIRLMLNNSGSTTVTWADIDTGAEASGTTYYVYAIAASASATTATFKISASSTSPSGITYYKKLGSFVNDSSSNITNIINNNSDSYVSTRASKSSGTIYQALTDGYVNAYTSGGSCQGCISGSGSLPGLSLYSDSSSSPTTLIDSNTSSSSTTAFVSHVKGLIKKGDYYQVTLTAGSCGPSAVVYFTPTSN